MTFKGTKFQIKVWKYLKTIPKGQFRTYLEVAKAIKRPKAARAVANAIGKNPYAPKIPCHRVIRSDGSLGGYSGKGGIDMQPVATAIKALQADMKAISSQLAIMTGKNEQYFGSGGTVARQVGRSTAVAVNEEVSA